MGNGGGRMCASIMSPQALEELEATYEFPWGNPTIQKEIDSILERRPNEEGRAYAEIVQIPRPAQANNNEENHDNTSNESSALVVEVELLSLKKFRRPDATLITMARNSSPPYYDAPLHTSFGFFAKQRQIELDTGIPKNSDKFQDSPGLTRLGYTTLSQACDSCWLLTMNGRPTQPDVVSCFATLRQFCNEFVRDEKEAMELYVPVIGFSPSSTICVRDVVQECISLAYTCGQKIEANKLKKLVFYVPNKQAFDILIQAFELERAILSRISKMSYEEHVANYDIENDMDRISQWQEAFASTHQSDVLATHLQLMIQTFKQHQDKALADAMPQLYFVICESGKHISNIFLDQWKNMPLFSEIPAEKRARYLRFTNMRDVRVGGRPHFEPEISNENESKDPNNQMKIKEKYALSQKQYEFLETLRRIGNKARSPAHADSLNITDAAFALEAIIHILSSLSAPVRSATITRSTTSGTIHSQSGRMSVSNSTATLS